MAATAAAPARASGIEAWYFHDDGTDQRLPHKFEPNRTVSMEQLTDLGVVQWALDADAHETDPELQRIRDERNYSYQDIITVSPETLPGYEEKIKSFFEEHIHTDEEIRYVLDGCGYFDVRDKDDAWIRIFCGKGDMIVLPEGMYHRFTMDESNYIKAMRLFVGEPVWTPYNRPQEENPSRVKYVEAFGDAAKENGAPPAENAAAEPTEPAEPELKKQKTNDMPTPLVTTEAS